MYHTVLCIYTIYVLYAGTVPVCMCVYTVLYIYMVQRSGISAKIDRQYGSGMDGSHYLLFVR